MMIKERLNGSLKWVVVILISIIVGITGTWEATQQLVINRTADRQIIVFESLVRKSINDSLIKLELHQMESKLDTVISMHRPWRR